MLQRRGLRLHLRMYCHKNSLLLVAVFPLRGSFLLGFRFRAWGGRGPRLVHGRLRLGTGAPVELLRVPGTSLLSGELHIHTSCHVRFWLHLQFGRSGSAGPESDAC